MIGDGCPFCGSRAATEQLAGISDWEFGIAGSYRYLRCDSCDLLRLDPFPTVEQLIAAYPDHYPAFQPEGETGALYEFLYRLHQKLFSLRKLRALIDRDARVLDVGCGNGRVLESFRRLGVEHLTGIDFSEKVIPILRAKGFEAFHGIFLDFPMSENQFQIIVMNNYLEHVLDPRAETSKAHTMLKPGGALYGTIPNFGGLDRALFGRYWGGLHVPRHTFQFTPATLERALQEAGFSRISITQDINPCHLAVSIQNYLQRNVPDLANNPHLVFGRMPSYNLQMLCLLPFNLIFKLLGRSGVMTFYAFK